MLGLLKMKNPRKNKEPKRLWFKTKELKQIKGLLEKVENNYEVKNEIAEIIIRLYLRGDF